MNKLKHLDLFSGIGGFSLGLEATGYFDTVAFCDYDPYCQKVLRKHWPWVTIYDDVKELNSERLQANGHNKIDIITGGYPCQPFSIAGRQKGEQDPRHVWPEMFRLVKELRPTWVIGENVSGHIKLGLDTVLENLESEGYSARAFSISASSIGAVHQRERVWILAHSRCTQHERSFFGSQDEDETREETTNKSERSSETSYFDVADTEGIVSNGREHRQHTEERDTERQARRESSNVAHTDIEGLEGRWSQCELREGQEEGKIGWSQWWESEPSVGRVAHGVPKRVDRLKSLGNSLVPMIPYYIGMTIKKGDEIWIK
jgi:DNA (cytosine-5)-methyltransferase 1